MGYNGEEMRRFSFECEWIKQLLQKLADSMVRHCQLNIELYTSDLYVFIMLREKQISGLFQLGGGTQYIPSGGLAIFQLGWGGCIPC